jgi:hypothetical protein
MSIYLMCLYGHTGDDKQFRDAWARTGKKLDMGKSCIRFRQASDLPLDVIGKAVAAIPPAAFIAQYENAHGKKKATKKK